MGLDPFNLGYLFYFGKYWLFLVDIPESIIFLAK